MDTALKIIQIVFWLITAAAAVFTAWKGIHELKLNREARDRDLRWGQAAAAKELIGEIHRSFYASTATQMLDWWEADRRPYPAKRDHLVLCDEVRDDGRVEISIGEIRQALAQPAAGPFTDKMIFIRDCFDWFFYYVDRIEDHIRQKLILREDVENVFVPYKRRLQKDPKTFSGFLDAHDYRGAIDFFGLR